MLPIKYIICNCIKTDEYDFDNLFLSDLFINSNNNINTTTLVIRLIFKTFKIFKLTIQCKF